MSATARKSFFNRRFAGITLIVIFGMALLGLGYVQESDAAPQIPIVGFNLQCLKGLKTATTADEIQLAKALQGTISARAIVCSFEVVMNATDKIIPIIADLMKPIAFAVIFLAVVLFGLRLTLPGGVKAPLGDGIILLFKASIVLVVVIGLSTNSSLNISRLAMGIQTELLRFSGLAFDSVISANATNKQIIAECKLMQDTESPWNNFAGQDPRLAIPESSIDIKEARIKIKPSQYKPGKFTAGADETIDLGVWKSIDCITGLVVGAGMGTITHTTLFTMFASMLSAGGLGIACFMATLTFFLTLLSIVLRSVFITMQAYIVIAVILMFLPLVIPTIMFKKTFDYFARYLALYIGIIFQPVLVIVFLGFAVQGIGFFLINTSTKDLDGTSIVRSTLESDPSAQVYSLWQVLGFDIVSPANICPGGLTQACKKEVRTERAKLTQALINDNPGKALIDFKGMATINAYLQINKLTHDMKEMITEPFGLQYKQNSDGTIDQTQIDYEKSKAANASWTKKLGDNMKNTDWDEITSLVGASVSKSNTDDGSDIINADNSAGLSKIAPLYMPFLDLRPDGTYVGYLEKLYKGNKTKYAALAREEPQLDENGNQMYEQDMLGNDIIDSATGKKFPIINYWGAHRWYGKAKILKDDTNFETWFMKKLFAAILCTGLMLYIFFSLNRDIPEIAHAITGSSAYVLMGGADGGTFAGLPYGEMLENKLRSTEDFWKKGLEKYNSKATNPAERLQGLVSSGRDAILGSASDNPNAKPTGLLNDMIGNGQGELGGLIKGIENETTGKKE